MLLQGNHTRILVFGMWRYTNANQNRVIVQQAKISIFVRPPTCCTFFHTTCSTSYHFMTLGWGKVALTAAFEISAFYSTTSTMSFWVLSQPIILSTSRNILNRIQHWSPLQYKERWTPDPWMKRSGPVVPASRVT